ncbi:MAG: hypothetical protein LBR58_10010 [Propionibacteriaceae bacterium]|jgi:hypothetical protein|nr:hypothetical protein [Propionibacteriaceae bacterium]
MSETPWTPNTPIPAEDTPAGQYSLDNKLPPVIVHGNEYLFFNGVASDAEGDYAEFQDGVKVYVGQSHDFEGFGTVTVLQVFAGGGSASDIDGGSGSRVLVEYQPA